MCYLFKFAFGQADRDAVNQVMDQWHKAAGEANFKEYFDLMDESSIFIGTDATERWNKQEFMDYAKPHFDKGKAWNFTSLERNVDFSEDGKTAWIDELLNTQMKICRGSGVLVKENGKWLIKHYVLSMTIPNDLVDQVVPLKSDIEDKIIEEYKLK
ncbi:nuclear transport factor 2 family protein [Sphingobacterium daejeonense]|uniref:nuclear transport factor 2 family protein n=1 Tax=Sphingobacterium daejeonense TaxID=371142 RepID=UPI0010C2F05A|nr:nuclear transport factor 2 family protein [Sphingobacterium daejeonense]VTP97509.1 Uncharacterised protein [Sphingobacterium daejeonense]